MKHFIKSVIRRVGSLTQTRAERRHARVGPAHLWKIKRDFQINFLQAMSLAPEHYLLDIGCGTLRGGMPLIAYLEEGHYYGVEIREETLEEGRKELRESGQEGKRPTLLLAPDISQLTIDRDFDYIWAFSVLIHMSDEILDHTLAFVRRHLAPEGVFYANVNIGENAQISDWQGFPVVARMLEFYGDACAANDLAVVDLGPLKYHGHVTNDEAQDNQRMLRIIRK